MIVMNECFKFHLLISPHPYSPYMFVLSPLRSLYMPSGHCVNSFVDYGNTSLNYTNFFVDRANNSDDCVNALDDWANTFIDSSDTLDNSSSNCLLPKSFTYVIINHRFISHM